MVKDLLIVVAHTNTSKDIQVINLINVIYVVKSLVSMICSLLQIHIRTHTCDKPYKCDIQYMVEDFVRIGTWKDTLEHTLVIILCDKGFIASSISK